MFGGHGVALPERLASLPGMSRIEDLGNLPVADLELFGLSETAWIAGLLFVVWVMPNSQQIMRHYRTALTAQPKPSWLQATIPGMAWQPTAAIGFAIGWLGFFLVIRAISAAPTEFLYFQF